ncbi:MAG: hypothetical protein IIY21_07100 [Clostridiales bacterium]|nr:hypothetical protein [Clostridiales bacterium]MBQ1571845.1 hypothetical protein [Clostridiales bacterium]
MSHNKSIEIYHKITKLPYSQCRRILKEHHWDLTRALLPDFYKIVDALMEALEQVMKSLEPFAEAVIETFTVLRNSILDANLENMTHNGT